MLTLKVSSGVKEKYWQAQHFTLSHGMSSTRDWYSTNRKGYRKNKYLQFVCHVFIFHILLVYILVPFLLPYSVVQINPKFISCIRFLYMSNYNYNIFL